MANHKKQFCPKGHDTFVTGRNSSNGCRLCRQNYQIKYNKLPIQKANVKRWADAHKDHRKDTAYKRIYGISLVEYKILCEVQNNICLICREQKPLVVDHCHITGKVRGLLCSTCNRAMGLFQDSSTKIRSALVYLEQAQTTVV